MKKTLSILLSILMAFSAFSVMPFNALAADPDAVGLSVNRATKKDPSLTFEYDEHVGYGNDVVLNASVDKNATGIILFNIGDSAYYSRINDGKAQVTITDAVPYLYSVSAAYPGDDEFDTDREEGYLEVCPKCGDNVYYYYTDNGETLNLFGSGATWDYTYDDHTDPLCDSPFYENRDIKTIIVGDGITRLGDYLFTYCYNVTSFTLPEGLTSIGNDATVFFEKMESIDIPSTVTSIGNGVFSNWKELKSVTIPEGVTSIPEYAFFDCFALESLTLPQNVSTVGNKAFTDTVALTDLFVPFGVDLSNADVYPNTNVWRYEALADQTGAPAGKTFVTITSHDQGTATTVPCNMNDARYVVKSVDVPGVTIKHTYNGNICTACGAVKPTPDIIVSVEDSYLSGEKTIVVVNVSDNANGTVSATVNGKEFTGTVLNGVANFDIDPQPVGNYTFTVSYSGDSVHAPATSNPVSFYVYGQCGDNAYYRLTGENNEILDIYGTGDVMLTPGEENPFYAVSGIKTITVEDGITGIGPYVFNEWSIYNGDSKNEAVSVTLPDSVTTIGEDAFHSANIKSVNIPKNVKTIGKGAFGGNTYLSSVTLPEGLENIGSRAFAACTNLPEITLPSTLKTIGNEAFSGCREIETVNIPAVVNFIGEEAFQLVDGNTAFTVDENNQYFTAVNGVLYTADMTELVAYPLGRSNEKYTVPGTVTTVRTRAFGNANLDSITFTKKLNNVAYGGFSFESIKDVYFGGTESDWQALLASTSGYYFTGATIHYCAQCGDDVYYYYTDDEEKNLVLFGSGDTWDYNWSDNKSPFYHNETAETLTVGDGITRIGNALLFDCNSLKPFTLPDTVTSLGDYAFDNCTGLDNLTLPDSITEIGEFSFVNCYELESITLPAKLETIGAATFSNCEKLSAITIPESVTTIGSAAFGFCNSLQSVNIPKDVTTIGAAPFYSCESLASITVDADNPNYSAEDGILYNKDKTVLLQYPGGRTATSFTVPVFVTTIGEASFAGETDIKNIVIHKNVSSIEHHAFYECSLLKDVYYGGTKSEWETLSDNIGNNNDKLITATIHYWETVSFNGNGASNTMAPHSDYTEFTYALPACEFLKDGRTFYKWQVGDELKAPEETIAVNDSVEVKAIWKYAEPESVDFSVDKSTTTVKGELILTDTRTGKVYKKSLSDVAASSLDEPLNADVNALIEKTKTALKNEAAGIAGSYTVSGEPTVADAVLGSLVDNRTNSLMYGYDADLPATLEATDANGDYKCYTLIEGDIYREHTVAVTLNATFTSKEEGITAAEKAAAEEAINSAAKGESSAKAVTIYWGKVKKADKIVVYAAYCGKNEKGKYKKIATLKGDATKYEITKLNGKALNQKKNVKAYVVAYRKVNGKYKKITKSLKLHVAGYKSKRTNTKAIKLKKSKFTLKKGKTAKIKGSIVLEDSSKKAVNHVRKLRFKSSNKKVATVSKSGKIKAKGKGTCTIYVFANNGKAKKVKVTVK